MNRTRERPEQRSDTPGRAARWAQMLGGLLVVSSIVVAAFASHAGAASLSNGVVTLKDGTSNVVASNPLANRQVISIVVDANSTLDRSSLEAAGFPSGAVPIKVLECADSGGLASNLPKKPTDCEPETVDSVAGAQADGSVYLRGFTVYALPDTTDLGVSNGTTCDDAQDQCVLGIFTNQNDFTKPHLFSGPFQVTSTSAGNGTSSGASSKASSSAPDGTVSAGVSVPPATLAFTGPPTIWPWLLGSGCVLLAVGTGLRLYRRRAQ